MASGSALSAVSTHRLLPVSRDSAWHAGASERSLLRVQCHGSQWRCWGWGRSPVLMIHVLRTVFHERTDNLHPKGSHRCLVLPRGSLGQDSRSRSKREVRLASALETTCPVCFGDTKRNQTQSEQRQLAHTWPSSS